MRLIDDALVARASQVSEESGQPVSCREGCGACCRQLVPVTEIEAHALLALVESLPDERRANVQARFETAISDLTKAGLIAAVRDASSLARQQLRDLGRRYFHLCIACPFLEDERCSIYQQRPLICREFLVISPPERCQTFGNVERLPLQGRLRRELGTGKRGRSSWVPLLLAQECAIANTETDQTDDPRPGPELLAEALGTQLRDTKQGSGLTPV